MNARRAPAALLATVTGVLAGSTVGLLVIRETPLIIVEAGLVAIGVGALVRSFPAAVRSLLAGLLTLKLSFQLFVAVALQSWATAAGHPEYVIGDDGTYFNAALSFSRYLDGSVGPGVVAGLVDFQSAYVYLATALFSLFGPDPLLIVVLNAGFAAVLVLLAFDLVRLVAGERPAFYAAIVVAFFPSLVLWSALNLKEAFTLFLVNATFWLLMRFQLRPRLTTLLVTLLPLIALETVRRFLFLGLVPLVVLGTATAPGLAVGQRAGWIGVASLASSSLLALDAVRQGGSLLPSLTSLEGRRVSSITSRARTSFQDTIPGQTGETFVVQVQNVTPVPSPALLLANSGTKVVVVVERPPAQSAAPAAGERASSPATPVLTQQPSSSAPTDRAASSFSTPSHAQVPVSTADRDTASASDATRAIEAEKPAAPSRTGAPQLQVETPKPKDPAPARPVEIVVQPAPSSTTAPQLLVAAAEPAEKHTGKPQRIPAAAQIVVSPGTVYARPGDIVVFGPPGTTPRPSSERIGLELPQHQSTVMIVSGESEAVVARTLAYAPRGAFYALFAPFPWEARARIDLVAIPEMLLWYVTFAGALISLAVTRRMWWAELPSALFIVGVLIMLMLAEGNVGSLFRHRAIVIPSTIVIAAPALARLATGLRTVVASRGVARRR